MIRSLTLGLWILGVAFAMADPAPVSPPPVPPKPGENFTNGVGMEFVWVVPLKCWVGKYDVTQQEYEKIVPQDPSHFDDLRRPVDSVSWYQAAAYARKLTAREQGTGILPPGWAYRLPASAEYDVYVGDASLADAVIRRTMPGGETAEVGTKRPNQFGLYDTRGNICQWCEDWFRLDKVPAQFKSFFAPVGDGGGECYKLARGGAVDDTRQMDVSFPFPWNAVTGTDLIGFRLVLAPARSLASEITPTKVTIMGQVRNPLAFDLATGEKLSLSQAILFKAGDFSDFADPGHVQLIHTDTDGVNDIQAVNVRAIWRGTLPDPLLRPGDTVIVRKMLIN